MFETERCSLSVFRKSDYMDVSKIFTDQEVRRYLGGIREPDSLKAILDDMLDPKPGSYYWVVREKRTEQFIGLVSLDSYHAGINQEVSYQFLPDWWGRSYAKEAVAAIIDFALNSLKLPALVAETQSANKPSCRLLEKLGMELERKVYRYGAEQSIYSIRLI